MESGGWGEHLELTLASLGAEDLHRLTSSALGHDVAVLWSAIQSMEAQLIRRIGQFDRDKGFAGSDSDSSQAWLRNHLRLSAPAAADRLRVARHLEELPHTFQALAAGEITYIHAAIIARTAEAVGDQVMRDNEETLLPVARMLDPTKLQRCARFLRYCVDPEGSLRDEVKDHERRWLDLGQGLDGMWFLEGMLDRESGDGLKTILDSLDGPPSGDDTRSGSKRRADALAELVRRQLDSGSLPMVGRLRPHTLLVVSAETLRGDAGAPGGKLQFGGMVHPEVARRLACDSSVSTVCVGPDGEPIGLGRSRRTVNARLWKLLVLRDGGCRFPGCGAPVSWTDAHHIRAWFDGGPTEMANLVLLCRRHHRKVHDGGWSLEWGEGGEMVAHPPWQQTTRAA